MKEKIIAYFNRGNTLKILGVVVIGALGYGIFYLYTNLTAAKTELTSITASYESNLKDLEHRLEEVQSENDSITATLSDQQKTNLKLERQKRRQEDKIDELTKLTTIDPELLKKYSKVYFLSENYVPTELEDIDKEYLSVPSKQTQILADVSPFLDDMLEEAKHDGIVIWVASAYRSFQMQNNLKNAYTVQYGAGTANSFSAEQGYSEHQLGTTLDFTTPGLYGSLNGFEKTTAYQWLLDNAYDHGFILSYPQGNSFYKYEPWHWRFVGVELARELNDEGKYFYDWDQRDIDEYLIKIFD